MADTNANGVPVALTKKGIQRVTDNTAGKQVVLPQGLITQFFGDELMQMLSTDEPEQSKAEGQS
ncbi:hypothetical protein HMF8227_02338 [Saliniradius amylolyticus]|uniref:Uncharacterized protein n=1 Tax=Saliniradius amylolyticus TaxID=2183582 RepID=A0A2S2E6B8_9ALTE|nr:hypothetical protein [Saliniradius amylolyticus]AWL12790.1 hypothetical protein HMF8227_02338 [Saliniradius amylolyticus]